VVDIESEGNAFFFAFTRKKEKKGVSPGVGNHEKKIVLSVVRRCRLPTKGRDQFDKKKKRMQTIPPARPTGGGKRARNGPAEGMTSPRKRR